MPYQTNQEKPQSILKNLNTYDGDKRRRELTRAGFSEYEVMVVIDPPDILKPLIDEILPQIPFFIPMKILKSSWGTDFLRDVKEKGNGYEKGNISAFVVGAAISPHDKNSLIFQEFSPELLILPDGRVSFTRSRVHYRGGIGRDMREFNIDVNLQRKFILQRMEKEFERNPGLKKRVRRSGGGFLAMISKLFKNNV
ncbi:MAG: hypothetical protein FWE25_04725 [Lachnospiraceae bacterium]|nr:hypothetical protein [Lachnospiraceae bacterium]